MIAEVVLLTILKIVNISFVLSKAETRVENVVRYTNLWAVQISPNDVDILEKLRMLEGFEIAQQKHQIPNLYLIIHRRHPRRGRYENKYLTNILLEYKKILWTEQIFLRQIDFKSIRLACPGKSVSNPSNYKKLLNDKFFLSQWYLQDCRKSRIETQYDLNVVPVWHHYKYFGYGIKVVVVDVGVQIDHPDLKNNYDPQYGYDFIKKGPSPEPTGLLRPDSHGTIVAGIIAMQANNKICGVGIAPLVTLGAVRISTIDEPETHYQEAMALSFHAKDLDVSNNSWGDFDTGKFLEPINDMVKNALKQGIKEGRGSKGLIFVFACGNGKREGDTCAHDSMASSMYTITVASVKHDGSVTGGSERCSNILVTVYGGDGMLLPGNNLVSTSTWSKCQSQLAGTSTATPVVSGIVALILEANSKLSWREVHHVFAWTNQVAPLADNKTWFRNKAGFYFSLDFGFGLADAFQAVTFAKIMEPISPMNTCILNLKINNEVFSRKLALKIKVSTNGCKNLPSEVNYMEHVQLITSVEYQRRGAIQILLISPSGTKTVLMESRRLDQSKKGLRDQILDTVHLWGEPSQGEWSIIFYDTVSHSEYQGTVTKLNIFIHGTKDRPPHYANTRTYREFPLPTYGPIL